jgi:hypothetical protein
MNLARVNNSRHSPVHAFATIELQAPALQRLPDLPLPLRGNSGMGVKRTS